MSSSLANYLSYKFQNRTIVISYVNGEEVRISIRGIKIREKVLEVLGKIKGSRGGGHENAVGAGLESKDLDFFEKEFSKIMNSEE